MKKKKKNKINMLECKKKIFKIYYNKNMLSVV